MKLLFDLFNSPKRGIRLSVKNVIKNYLEKDSVLLTLHNQRYRFSNRNGIRTNQKLILTRSFRENKIAASLWVRDRELSKDKLILLGPICNCVICLDRYFPFPFLNLFLSYIAGNISELSLNAEERGNFTNHIFSSFSEKKPLDKMDE